MIRNYEGQAFDTVVEKNELTVVQFHATWCGPCKMLSPVIDSYGKKNSDLDIVKIDIDQYRPVALEAKIKGVPTLVAYKNGAEVDRISGYMPEEKLAEWINKNK